MALTAATTAPPVGSAPPTTRRFLASVPLTTVGLVAAVCVVTLIGPGAASALSAGVFDLRVLILNLLTADSITTLPLVAIALLAVGAYAERTMGARRVLFAFFVGGLITSVVGLAIGAFEATFLASLPLNSTPTAGAPPTAGVIVVALAASCFSGVLWRRRIRIFVVILAVALFLYSASANDLYTLLAIPIGIAAGKLTGGRSHGTGVRRSSRHETRVLLAAVTALTAIGPFIATIWGADAGLLSIYGWLSYDPLTLAGSTVCAAGSSIAPCPDATTYDQLQPAAGFIAAVPLLILVVAAWGILRGRRGALGLAVAMNLLVFVGMTFVLAATEPETFSELATVRGADAAFVWQTVIGLVIGALVPLAVAVVLVVSRRAVTARSAPGARRTFFVTVGVAAAGTLLASFVGTLLLANEFMPVPSVSQLLGTLPLRLLPPSLVPADTLVTIPVSAAAQAVWYLPPTVFWVACLIASVRLVFSSRTERGDQGRTRAREILQRGGGGTLSFMATWPGNSYWFATGADAAVAYQVHGGVAVTLGGPFGADRALPEVGRSFVDFCESRGWVPVFYSVDDEARTALDDLGWQSTVVADESLLDPQTWTPAGKKRQDVRTATNRAGREGVVAQWTSWEALAFLDRAQIREISEGWVADKTIPEMQFTLGSIDEVDDPAVRLMLAREASGRIVAVTSWIPVYGDGRVIGYTLDVMRRRDDAMPGVMEFVIGAAVEQMRTEECTVLSLSGSPLASHRDDGEPPAALDRILETLSALLEPAYGFRSLATFKKKFQPDHRAMWMLYSDPVNLPVIGVALLRCYVPGLTIGSAARLMAKLRRHPPR